MARAQQCPKTLLTVYTYKYGPTTHKPNFMYFHTAGVTVQLANVGSREIRPWGLESSRAFDDRSIDRGKDRPTDGRTWFVRFASSEGTELILI